MQLLEKLVILTLMIFVLIYTIQVNRTTTPKDPVPSLKQEKPISNSPVFPKNEDSFFPTPEPPLGAEDIKEETFTESP